jgi:hypothetical protein
MGSPISSTKSEKFIQHLEDALIKHFLDSKSIIFYARYVDDILIIYDSSHTSPKEITQYTTTYKSTQLKKTQVKSNS